MSFFPINTHNANADDALAQALVSLSSDDPNVFVGAGVLQNSDIFAAISIIAGDLASNPIQCDSTLYQKMINEQPNEVMDGWHLKYALAVCMLLNGNSFAMIDGHELKFIPNDQITVEQDTITQQLKYTYSPAGSVKRSIDPSQILHFKCFTRDGVTGISPLYALKDERKIQKSGNSLLSAFFANGIHGTTVVKINGADLSQEAKDNVRAAFDNATTGDKAMNTVVIDDGMDVSTLPLNTDILKLVNSNDWSTRQIAKAFGLPPERLGVENQHSNQQQSNVQYLQGTLQHYEDCFTAELNAKLGQHFEFDNSRLLSLDPAAQQQMAVDGYTNGIYTLNEARSLMKLPPTADGDKFKEMNNSNELRTTNDQPGGATSAAN